MGKFWTIYNKEYLWERNFSCNLHFVNCWYIWNFLWILAQKNHSLSLVRVSYMERVHSSLWYKKEPSECSEYDDIYWCKKLIWRYLCSFFLNHEVHKQGCKQDLCQKFSLWGTEIVQKTKHTKFNYTWRKFQHYIHTYLWINIQLFIFLNFLFSR